MKINKKFVKLIIILLSISLIFLIYTIYNYSIKTSLTLPSKDKLLVHYIDVDQGDSILVQFNNKNLLIDAGPNNKKTFSYLKRHKIKKLDYVIITHPHDDHIGGMSHIINHFNINKFYSPNITANTDSFKNMLLSLNKRGLKVTSISSEIRLDLKEKVCCFIIPSYSNHDNLNNYSLIIKITYNNTSFLFSGDAESLREEELINKGYNLSADVLKVGHHGSKSSTSQKYLDEVNPKIAVISCGKGNDYGHPHKETLLKLKEKGIITFRTDIDKTIVLESDGNKIVKRK
ncbi:MULTISPECIES: ComEC/Rec2 family competence protein [Clostridium]|uniref:Ribonuclease BN n=2 Tax=Clostridium TaxID=1485 RepID=A0A151ALJ3_9CLOT|nr:MULTISPECIES: ComEC/Rec2 family competence protein [Clostridium]KYH28505.1 ribonuclease BN [Clostridium colicanis DSM 13634]MBE6042797.1 MBL fold metallo-hydrolase [Clostridium thermopalmarium]PRR69810.1 ComEC family competence protein [Clostridium thermopalmarium DSM 5974]PVZ21625.1 competence protein ComEC [Clostridium thermopalmarium DSM 5974]